MSDSEPLVSVVIPAYNAEKYLKDAVDSIQRQSYSAIELIIIEDCSTDNTLEVARNIEKMDRRVRVVENIHNMGVSANRRRGVELSRGEYICWQDADDISLPDRIAHQVNFLETHPEVGVVGGFITFFDETGERATRTYAENDSSLRETIFRYNPVAQPASMMRRSSVEMVGNFSSKYRLAEDLEMLFRIGEKYKFGNVQEIVLKYRQSPQSLTAANLRKMECAALEIKESYRMSSAYHYTRFDALYNFGQKASLYMPKWLRMKIFSLIRGDT